MNRQLEQAYEGGFRGEAHYFALRVYIEDTDVGGVVYHANYLRFLERARSDLLRALGIDQRAAMEAGKGVYAVTEVHIRYRKPAKLEDELVIISRMEELHRASCVIRQEIMRGQELLSTATVAVAFVTPNGRPSRHPPEWLQKFKSLKPGTPPASAL